MPFFSWRVVACLGPVDDCLSDICGRIHAAGSGTGSRDSICAPAGLRPCSWRFSGSRSRWWRLTGFRAWSRNGTAIYSECICLPALSLPGLPQRRWQFLSEKPRTAHRRSAPIICTTWADSFSHSPCSGPTSDSRNTCSCGMPICRKKCSGTKTGFRGWGALSAGAGDFSFPDSVSSF